MTQPTEDEQRAEKLDRLEHFADTVIELDKVYGGKDQIVANLAQMAKDALAPSHAPD